MTNLRWKIVTVVAVFIVFFAVGVYPMLAARYGLPAPGFLMDKPLKLGLDLKGGVHLVLHVQTEDALRLETDLEIERLREELTTRERHGDQPACRQFHAVPRRGRPAGPGCGVPSGRERGCRRTSIAAPASNGTYTFTMKPNIQVNLREEAVVQARQTIERRVNELGVTEPSIAQQGNAAIRSSCSSPASPTSSARRKSSGRQGCSS